MSLSFIYYGWTGRNLPAVLSNWFSSMLITFVTYGWIFSKRTSLRWFDSYSVWMCWRAARDWHHIQTITTCLSNWEFRISMPSSFSSVMSLSVWCDLGLVLLRRASILSWSSCASIDVVHVVPLTRTSIFTNPKCKKRITSNIKLITQTQI